MDTSSPHGPYWSGLEAMLWFQQQLTQPSKDQICAKNKAVCGGRAGGWQLSVGEWRTRLQEGLRDREGGCNQREEEKISEILTRKKWEGMRYWRVRARKTRLTSQTLHE